MSISLPPSLRAGDTLTATWQAAEYPSAAGWALRLTLINAANRYAVVAVASGLDYLLTAAAATTAPWVAGAYTWAVDATRTTERRTIATGSLSILPDLVASPAYDTRTAYRKALEAAELALATYGSKAYLSGIDLGDRKQTFTSPGEFLAYVSKLRAQCAREDSAERMRQGLAPKNRLLVRFRGR